MIAVDWGGSSFRAFRLDAAGQVIAQRRCDQGVLSCRSGFDQVLAQQLADWDEPLVVMAGMIGSRQGWRETPYVDCPASLAQIAGGLQPLPACALPGREIWIAPGLRSTVAGRCDVMRGEETQVAGLLPDLGDAVQWICLPGTHSKLVQIEQGCIVDFSTAMTGELFQLLREHSLLGRLMQPGQPDEAAFDRGLDDSAGSDGLLRQLFAVRTHGLFATLPAASLASYLSGLLIGSELRSRPDGVTQLLLVGADTLTAAYARACARLGIGASTCHGEESAAQGLYRLARIRGLRG
jgi:2-dehydro-3-deoxygalactonokinase